MPTLLQRLAQVVWLGAALAAVLTAVAGALLPAPSSNCQRKCGQVDIPYPFGIGSDADLPDHCSMPGFNLSCMDGRPYYIDVEVLAISLQQGFARMRMDMSPYCYNSTSKEMEGHFGWELDLTGTPYRLSDTGNMFTVVGCSTLAYIADQDNVGKYMGGCVSMCRSGVSSLTNGSCSGIGCCRTAIPKNLQFYQVWFDPNFNTSEIYNVSRCSYAALIEASNFTFSTSYATSTEFNDTYGGQPPLLVDSAIWNETCEVARSKPESFACVSSNSQCFDSVNGPGYICNCSKGFQGNPYLVDGCKDVDECNGVAKNSCSAHAICKNTQGGFECTRSPHYPKGNAYNGTCVKDQSVTQKITISIGIFACFLASLLLLLGKEWIKHKRRIIRQEYISKMNECFQQNGGQLLMDMMKVESNTLFKLYNREEIELATNNFDKNSIIGEGGQGTVYIGQNLDAQNDPVAIKICKGFDEIRRREFGQELLILSRVKHENIVQLLGCSLQFEAPVLVYEYVPNQTLHYLIHSQDDASIRTLEMRLKISSEIATALAYLHSLSHPIFHGDVKSVNILIGHDLSAKVSDFGCSMIRSADDNVQIVNGTMGYLDPEYLLNFELTDKSDVYSYGVVLLELLTRRTALSKTKESLVAVFTEAVNEGKLMELIDNEIANQENMDLVLQVATVARRCLVMTGQHRPLMSQVAEELQGLVGPVPQRTQVFHGVKALLFQGQSSNDMTDDYISQESTDYYNLEKKASMSIEFAR
ncbi:wall-associated receptor kinase 2-like isoform X1 [Panicum miliaceum]|uniref:Wall-associated receptor kinase 2-like isoform X1 n=1 Tax=Panicum miliaceum TaxID=4540 RepID=A0A3L6QBP2_PANMI|nr:wall-associated receptor kinase 2-like isoform X1 [Panicum miliaceum]